LLKKDGWGSAAAAQLAGWDPYDQNTSADFFDPEWMFGIAGGFDVVIGNPPYLSHDRISEKQVLKNRYESYEPFADLYCYFIEKAIALQNNKGVLSFITSNSFLRAEYGSPIRQFIQKENVLLNIVNLEDAQVFESAIVNVVVLVSQKKINNPPCFVFNRPFDENANNFAEFVKKHGFFYDQAVFKTKSWNLIKPVHLNVQRKIEQKGMTLEQLGVKIRLGLATGNNEVFVIDEEKRKEFVSKNPKNAEIIKPVLRGRDIFRYRYENPSLYILLTKNGINVQKDFPDIYNYFDSFGSEFKKRGAQGKHWTNLRAVAFFEDFKKEKIVWIELTDIGRFALCTDEIYLLNSAYFLLPPPKLETKYLLGVLNSRLIHFYLSLIAETSGMGISRWINNYVKEFPIAVVTTEMQHRVSQFVEQILTIKRSNPAADTSALEEEIDHLVYQVYGLTEDEIAIVEGQTGITSAPVLDIQDDMITELPAIEVDETTDPEPTEVTPGDYGLYKCGICGKMVTGFMKNDHVQEKHRGKKVEWQKMGK
jgi:adenine-specific DNA-methyltransferase